MEAVLISAGAIAALLDAGNPMHKQAHAILKDLRDRGALPLLTNFIVTETYSVLSSLLGPDAARTWLRHNIWPVERVSESDEERAREIVLETDGSGIKRDCLSYTDATTIAVMERLGITKIFSFGPVFEERGFSPGSIK